LLELLPPETQPEPEVEPPVPSDRELAEGWHQYAQDLEEQIHKALGGLAESLCVQRRVPNAEIEKLLMKFLTLPRPDDEEVSTVE